MCVCVCVCVCVRERERERERVCVCVCARLSLSLSLSVFSSRSLSLSLSLSLSECVRVYFYLCVWAHFNFCLYLHLTTACAVVLGRQGQSISCNTLQHVATHCNTLQHVATHCNTLQHVATCCDTLQHTATHCNTLHHTAPYCNTRLIGVVQHTAYVFTLQHTAPHCNTLHHTATHCNTGLIGVVQSEQAEERKIGLWTLTMLPFERTDARVVSVVKALAKDTDLDVRRAAVEAAQFTAVPGDSLVLAALADRLLVDEDFSVRRAAAEGIRKLTLDRHTHLGNACREILPHLPAVYHVILRCWAPRRRDGHTQTEVNVDKIRFSADELVASVRTAGINISEKDTRGIFALAPATKDKLLMCSSLSTAVAATANQDRLPEFVLEVLVRTLMDTNISVRYTCVCVCACVCVCV